MRGDPDVDTVGWVEISISHDCEKEHKDQFCALKQHQNLADLEYKVEDTGEVYHIVQSCMPININVTDCFNDPEGIFYVAVA